MSSKKPAAQKPTKTAAAPGTALAPVGAGLPMNLPAGLKMVKRVTLPSLALKVEGDARALLFASEMRVSKIEDKPDAQGKKREPATICDVGDVTTGEQFIFIVPAVVKANLERDYSEKGADGRPSYVGRVFYIRNEGKRKDGQRYNDFTIIECDASELTAKAQGAD